MADNHDARAQATLLLTRPQAASDRFAQEIAARDLPIEVVVSPLMEIMAVDGPVVIPSGTDVIFTSSNAVSVVGHGKHQRAWCVGPRTKTEAKAASFDAVEAGQTADALVATLAANAPTRPLLHLRGRHQRGDVATQLCAAGLNAQSQVVYDQVARPPDEAFFQALSRNPLIIPLFSPRSAELFVSAASPVWSPKSGDRLLVLSAAVLEMLPPHWSADSATVDRPVGSAMLDGIAQWILP